MTDTPEQWKHGPKVTDLRRRATDKDGIQRAVLATLGHDRPGLVAALSALIANLGLSIEDSRMTVLGGEFAVLMSVTGVPDRMRQLESAFARFCDEQALASLFRLSTERSKAEAIPYRVSVSSLDHQGIVRGVAEFFSSYGVNIVSLDTQTRRAPHTGTMLFDLQMTIAIPQQNSISELRRAFDEFCAEQNLDGELTRAR